MISSFCEGRVRLRHPALKDADSVGGLVAMLNEYPGVLETRSNLLTGSLLVLYDPAAISREDLARAAVLLEEQLGAMEPAEPTEQAEGGRGCARTLRSLLYSVPAKYEIGLLNASFGLCLLGLLGPRRLHYWAGGAFALLAALHLLRRR
ncbi:MAG: hypothetical protein LBM64_10015 [Deltaproteobacteria bacterium]|jgi:hypothetical protein|nr:hypothetical protein [Deltaproteobacteria bacterium]